MKILVTGAAGFIGSHLAEKLLRRGDQVVGLDNFDPYYDPRRKRANERRLAAFPAFHMIEADVRDRPKMHRLLAAENFDAVAHLAALAGVRNAVAHPDTYVQVDYVGAQNLMDGARASGVGNFVFASTSSVYGASTITPFEESDPCDRPLQPYAAAKRAAEMLGFTYHHLYGLNFTALRFFTVYGPNARPDQMAYLVADSVATGRQIPLYEGGAMIRDWTYVDDTTEGVVSALDRPLGFEIINLGRGEPVLLSRFVALIEELAGAKANLVHRPKPAADVVNTSADIAKAARLLDYRPRVTVEEGVARFWEWFAATREEERGGKASRSGA
jgi:UDP-glucuronate 4-epimerase